MTPAAAIRGIRMGADEIAFAVKQRRAGFSFQSIANQLCRETFQVKIAVDAIETADFLAMCDQLINRIGKVRAKALMLQCADACE